jgi:hypothetical protein
VRIVAFPLTAAGVYASRGLTGKEVGRDWRTSVAATEERDGFMPMCALGCAD